MKTVLEVPNTQLSVCDTFEKSLSITQNTSSFTAMVAHEYPLFNKLLW
jgi:hypothetical protein